MDAQGINQHHDGISGTAKQAVADDYNWRIFQSIAINNPLYAEALNQQVQKVSKITNAKWLWCSRLNGTYLDCPISQNPSKDHIVVAHNPSTYDQGYLKLKVSHGNYKIQAWDTKK